MRYSVFFLGIAAAMLASCTIQDDFRTPARDDVRFFATFEQPGDDGTKVYATEKLYLRWDADDRVSIFNKNTYNQQYRFLGETGANAGEFGKVEDAGFVTGNPLEHVVSFYPYAPETIIGENEEVTYIFPAEQFYRGATFGPGANPMFSVSYDNFLKYLNVGGYLSFKLYGEVSVNSITLHGNRDEWICGKGIIQMTSGEVPGVNMIYDASFPSTDLVLTCTDPVALGNTEDSAKEFWLVIPPLTFSQGFTITVDTSEGTFRKKTAKSITIERNQLSRMAPIKIEMTESPDIVFEDRAVEAICVDMWDTNSDGRLSYAEAAAVTDLGTAFKRKTDIVKFNELQYFTGLTEIAEQAFAYCENLISLVLPESVTVIGTDAFMVCSALTDFNIHEGVTDIGPSAFTKCTSLGNVVFPASLKTIGIQAFSGCAFTSLEIPAGVTEIGNNAFNGIPGLTSIRVDEGNPVYDSREGCNAIIETETNDLLRGCVNTVIPNTVTSVHQYAYYGVAGLATIDIPASVTSLGNYAFGDCPDLTSAYIPASVTSVGLALYQRSSKLTSIVVDSANPVYDSREGCNAVIETETNTLVSTCSKTVIPGTVTAIGQSAYSDNEYPAGDFVIPEGITFVGQVAFAGCNNLVSLTLPSTLQEFGIYAFAFISSLNTVTSLALTPPTASYGQWLQPFQSNGPDFKIYVPAESLEAYKSAVGWSTYADVIFAIE